MKQRLPILLAVGSLVLGGVLLFVVRSLDKAALEPVEAPPAAQPEKPAPQVTAEVQNLTRPGETDFVVGDRFRVVVSSEPDLVVSNTASFNGGPFTSTSYGKTGPDGKFALEGVMKAEHVGSWHEIWSAGAGRAALLKFQVRASAPPKR